MYFFLINNWRNASAVPYQHTDKEFVVSIVYFAGRCGRGGQCARDAAGDARVQSTLVCHQTRGIKHGRLVDTRT